MNEIALFYNFSEERMRKAKFALLPLKIRTRAVSKSEYNHPLGYLAGIKEIEPAETEFDGNGFDEEMIVMHNFTSKTVDGLIRALNKCGVGRVPLKAVITSTNKDWNSVQLYNAVKADFNEMSGKNK